MTRRSRILVVDDSDLSRAMAKTVLEADGHEVTCVDSALGLTRTVQAQRPDLLLLDISMPAMTGDRAVELLRKQSKHHCTILLYSDRSERELRALADQVGADGFVIKDGDVERLLHEVRVALIDGARAQAR